MTDPTAQEVRDVASVLFPGRSPGLNGTFEGTCVACLRPTDTGLGVDGDPDWHAGFLVALGVPEDQAIATIETSNPPRRAGYQVCEACAAAVGLPTPVLAVPGAELPTIRQPGR